MRKLSLLALMAFVSGAAFAQDAPAVKRTFRVYMDAISGNVSAQNAFLTSDGGVDTYNRARSLWGGNEFEIGMGYGQNWAKVPWLTTRFTIKFGINPVWIYKPGDVTSTVGRFNNQPASWLRGEVALDFSKYFTMYIDSRLLMGFTAQWAWSKGAHAIGLQAGLEMFAGNATISDGDYRAMQESKQGGGLVRPVGVGGAGAIVDAFWIQISWLAKMPKGFANFLSIRPFTFTGDSPTEILDGIYIRIENTLSWSNSGFTAYLRIRYNIKNIASPVYTTPAGQWKNGINHDLSLRAGVSYAYDFSKL